MHILKGLTDIKLCDLSGKNMQVIVLEIYVFFQTNPFHRKIKQGKKLSEGCEQTIYTNQ